MQSINNNANTANTANSAITTLTKFIFIALICILVNIPLYFMDEKWIAGLFTGAWLGAAVLLFLYNSAFNLNITSYSLSNFFNNYLAPILVYVFWIISIYWLVTGNADLAENPSDSSTSRNIAAVFTAMIPFLAIVVSIYYNYKPNETNVIPKAIGYSIVAFLFGLLCYYINVLRTSCYGSNTGCWAYAGWSTFLAFIIITVSFIIMSVKIPTLNPFVRMFQIFPKNLQNITAPINIFSIIIYLVLWISAIIVFFRHDDTFGDEEYNPVNILFTIIAILSFFLLFFKQTDFASSIITRIIQYFISPEFSPWSILLHIVIIILFIFSINVTTSSLHRTGWSNNPSILTIFISILVLILSYIGILYYNYTH
jgi:uncharacterized membrane protein YidH (DUF202 family)